MSSYPLRKILFIFLTLLIPLSCLGLDADYYSSSSLLTSGRWVKIKVNESGIQQITHKQLREWGFSDPEKVAVYGFGGVTGYNEIINKNIPDDVAPQPLVRTNDRILFYGESNARNSLNYWSHTPATPVPAINRNHVADAGYYFLTEEWPEANPEPIPFVGNILPAITSHFCVESFEEEIQNPFRCGRFYYGRDMTVAGPQKISFPLYHRDLTTDMTDKISLRTVIIGSNGKKITLTLPEKQSFVSREISLTQHTSSAVLFHSNAENAKTGFFTLPVCDDRETFEMTVDPSADSFSFAAVDYAAIAYPRRNLLGDSPSLLMLYDSVEAGTAITIADISDETLVWNVDNAFNVRPYTVSRDAENKTLSFSVDKDYAVTSEASTALRIIAFNPSSQHLTVEFVETIKNTNIHALPVPDMLILSSDLCYPEALRLAQIHHDRLGQDVAVVRQCDVFNEFSSGTPSLFGIRRMVKSFFDRNPKKMKSLLLFGGASYDNRGVNPDTRMLIENGALLLNYGIDEYPLISTNNQSFSHDGYFGILSDTSTPLRLYRQQMDINVGRIPAISIQDAHSAVNKIDFYLSAPYFSEYPKRIVIAGGSGDRNSHMDDAEEIVNTYRTNDKEVTVIKAYDSLYDWVDYNAFHLNSKIAEYFRQGVRYFTYSGHGSGHSLQHFIWSKFMTLNTDYEFPPFAMLSTCESYTFDYLQGGMVENMIYKEKGGMIGVIASGKEVFQSKNSTFAKIVTEYFSKALPGTLTGDIYRLARNEIMRRYNYNSDLIINTCCYNFCGDPALPLYVAESRITISSVNSHTAKSGEIISLTPLSSNTIEGYVAARDNLTVPDETFSGDIIVSLYESPADVTTFARVDGETATTITCDENVMTTMTAKVTQGRFSINLTPPEPIHKGKYNRLSIIAFSSDRKSIASTVATNLKVDGSTTSAPPADTQPPVVGSFFIDDNSFADGDITNGDFTACAVILPDRSGIYTSRLDPAKIARITIDGKKSYPVAPANRNISPDGSVVISMPFYNIDDGPHSITLFVSDNAGNTTNETIRFTVINSPEASLSVRQIPAETEATISLKHSFGSSPDCRLLIEDASGNLVFSRASTTFPFDWNLCDNQGKPVADGIYCVRAFLSSDHHYTKTPKIDIIVVRKQ